eukprot:6180333-Pleurochrysis_carterae.AAC.2
MKASLAVRSGKILVDDVKVGAANHHWLGRHAAPRKGPCAQEKRTRRVCYMSTSFLAHTRCRVYHRRPIYLRVQGLTRRIYVIRLRKRRIVPSVAGEVATRGPDLHVIVRQNTNILPDR